LTGLKMLLGEAECVGGGNVHRGATGAH
jgi:hypothetical protein